MLKVRKINGKYWLFVADGVLVLIFDQPWECSSYTLLRWGILPSWS